MDWYAAIENDDLNQVKEFIDSGVDVNTPDADGDTPLTMASIFCNYNIVKLLLEAGADPNIPNSKGDTPLITTTYSDFRDNYTSDDILKIVQALLAAGADPNHKGEGGNTALIRENTYSPKIIEALLAAGADPTIQNDDGKNVLMVIAEKTTEEEGDDDEYNKNNRDCLQLILTTGIDTNVQDTKGNTALMFASENSSLTFVKMLLEAGADVNKKNNEGKTALMFASQKDNIEVVQTLLDSGAEINAQTNDGKTPLLYASDRKNPAIALMLLAKGANPKLSDNNNNFPLMFAVKNKNIDFIRTLLDAGVNVNQIGFENMTSIMIAAYFFNDEVMQLLIAKGANVNYQQSPKNSTALITAAIQGYTAAVELLLQAGANPNLQESTGKSPLYVAAFKGHTDVVQLLLSQEGIIDTMLKSGKSVYDYALEGKFKPEINVMIIKKFQPKGENDEIWTGWTQSDVSRLETIFDKTNANNYAFCPVCLKYVERSEACMYMSHNCTIGGGFFHGDLYNKYKNDEGKIYWCTICGRIALGHRHYSLDLANKPKPGFAPQKPNVDPFEKDCRLTNGGGGLPEKYARFRRLTDFAHELMEVGEISRNDALTQLIEETWNAPLIRAPLLARNFAAKKPFRKNFPANQAPIVANEAAGPVQNVMRPAENRNDPNLQPIVHPNGINAMSGDEVANVIQFRHRKQDGTINTHDDSFISPAELIDILEHKVTNRGADYAIYCWAHPSCTAYLYPEEIKVLVDQGLIPEDLYNRYKAMFNVQMRERGLFKGGRYRQIHKTRKAKTGRRRKQRGGQQDDFFKEAIDAECVIIRKSTRGGSRRRKVIPKRTIRRKRFISRKRNTVRKRRY